MPTVGYQLRAAREAQKLSVQDVAEATNMRADHITALEEGNYAPFPAPVYVRGSIRTYARLLKLDVPAIVAALNEEMAHAEEQQHISPRRGPNRTMIDWLALQLVQFGWKRSLVVITALALLVFIWIWSSWQSRPVEDPLSDLPPPIYQPGPSTNSAYLPLPAE